MDQDESRPELKLGLGVTLQLIAVLVAIGIAWGSLSTKQASMESQQQNLVNNNAAVLQKLDSIQDRLTKLESTIRREGRAAR